EKAARYARAAWLRKSAPGPEKLGISYPGVPENTCVIMNTLNRKPARKKILAGLLLCANLAGISS
ncbi:hypothetical protein, partial [Sutterella wadsworthensis]|uniref:hypothetical protein n=2 Tax=Sutterella wadsworthensis TaxID=40545 RepID=UPI0039770D80